MPSRVYVEFFNVFSASLTPSPTRVIIRNIVNDEDEDESRHNKKKQKKMMKDFLAGFIWILVLYTKYLLCAEGKIVSRIS